MPTRTNVQNRKDQAELLQVVGARMKQARELSNLSQSEAAARFGYRNSSKLSKVERATNSKSIPLWLLVKAARIYQVSVDFLVGLSLDWDNSPRVPIERESSNWLLDEWEKNRARDMAAIRALNDRLETIDGAVQATIEQTFETHSALIKFIELNPDFENEMRGGATLLKACEKQVAAAKEARARLKRFHVECRAIGMKEKDQLELFESEE